MGRVDFSRWSIFFILSVVFFSKPFLMQQMNIGQWTVNVLVQALFRTFLHSLWEGIILAVLAGLVIVCSRKAAAALRYNLFAVLLLLFLCAVGGTFVLQLRGLSVRAYVPEAGVYGYASSRVASRSFAGHSVGAVAPQGGVLEGLSQGVNAFTQRWASFLMGVWTFIFLGKCVQLTAGFYHINRLRHAGTRVPGREWIERTCELARGLGIGRRVRLLESRLAEVPMAIGFFKPLILVPMGLLTHLPADQLHAILLHELGHIRRQDYLVNLLQRFAETVFFFNPAVLWLFALLRRERECCCDDLVLLHTGNRKSYLDALVGFQEYRSAALALPLGGNVNPMFGRIQRMVSRENKPLNGAEKIFILLGIFVIPVFGFMGKREEGVKKVVAAAAVVRSLQPKSGAVAGSHRKGGGGTGKVDVRGGKVGFANKGKDGAVYASDSTSSASDTLPVRKDSGYVLQAGPEDFTGITKTASNDGGMAIVIIEATDNTGRRYVLKGTDKSLTDLSIDGVAVAKDQLRDYDELIPFIERIQEMRAHNIPKSWEGDWLKMQRLTVHFAHLIDENTAGIKEPDELMARQKAITAEYRAEMASLMAEFQKHQDDAHRLAAQSYQDR